MSTAILLPAAGLAGLTAIVWCWMYWERLGEMRERRIRPEALATHDMARSALTRLRGADNLRNLTELPVLFYALCGYAALSGVVPEGLVAGAWLYVALRALHSLIHCTYNRVVHRFVVYVASSLVLFALWGLFVAALLTRA